MSAADPATDPAPAGSLRAAMPHQLRELAGVTGEVVLEVAWPVTLGATLDALERAHPPLAGTIRDRRTGRRRPMIRIYAAGEDLSDAGPDTELPAAVADGRQPLRLVGAIAGG